MMNSKYVCNVLVQGLGQVDEKNIEHCSGMEISGPPGTLMWESLSRKNLIGQV